MIRVGLSTAAFYGRMETEDMAEHLHAFGPAVCEVFLETYSEYSRAFGETVRERLGDIPAASVHPKGTQFELDLFGRSKRQVADAMRLFTGVCDAGQALGARWYVFHGPGTVNTQRSPQDLPEVRERVGEMRAIAAARGMDVLWENVSWCSVRGPEDIAAVKRLLPGMGFVLDVKQAYRARLTPGEVLGAMGEGVRHVHALDVDADGKLCLPGHGGLTDWPLLARQLRDLGYAGAVILEPYTVSAEGEDALRWSLDYLRGVFA